MSTASVGKLKLTEVDGLEIISLIDNSVDFLSIIDRKEVQSFRQWTKKQRGEREIGKHSELPVAEHGFSMLIRILCGRKSISVLFDTGVSASGVVENAKRMSIELNEVEYVVLSHGHYDHFGGLQSVLKAINKPNLRLSFMKICSRQEKCQRPNYTGLPPVSYRRPVTFSTDTQNKAAFSNRRWHHTYNR